MAEELAGLKADIATDLHACTIRQNALTLFDLAIDSARAGGLDILLEVGRADLELRATVRLDGVTMCVAPLSEDWTAGLDVPVRPIFRTRRRP